MNILYYLFQKVGDIKVIAMPISSKLQIFEKTFIENV